jgi:hypothetical protein
VAAHAGADGALARQTAHQTVAWEMPASRENDSAHDYEGAGARPRAHAVWGCGLTRDGAAYCFAHFTQPCQPSPKGLSGRPAHRPFRGLLGVHSRYGLHTRAVTVFRDTLSEGFSYFVTSIAAPVASGWSGCRVGLAPTGKRRLIMAHTQTDIRQEATATLEPFAACQHLIRRLLAVRGISKCVAAFGR